METGVWNPIVKDPLSGVGFSVVWGQGSLLSQLDYSPGKRVKYKVSLIGRGTTSMKIELEENERKEGTFVCVHVCKGLRFQRLR